MATNDTELDRKVLEDIASICRFQVSGWHGLTCRSDECDALLFPVANDNGEINLCCPMCNSEQVFVPMEIIRGLANFLTPQQILNGMEGRKS